MIAVILSIIPETASLERLMKALMKSRAERGLWLVDTEMPAVGSNDVLIRVDRTGICGTDLHIYNWDAWAQQTIPVPMVVGHEFVGEIVEVGGNVKDFFPGEIVSGEGHVVCGHCRNCLAGRRHLCADTQLGGHPAGKNFFLICSETPPKLFELVNQLLFGFILIVFDF